MNVTIFENKEFGEIRTIEIDGKPYFVGKDIAEMLGYTNPTKAISTHCKGVSKMGIPSNGGIQEMSVIPEGDLYRLIIKSKLPKAQEFEAWVMEQVLPQLRKNGAYSISKPLSAMDQLKLQYQVLETHEEKINEVSQKVNNLEQTMTIDHGQAVNVKLAVDLTVRKLCCGNESNAYMNKKLRSRVYRYVWKNIKDYFNITAYHNLLRKDVDVCINYINSLALQGALLREVQQENSQMCMGV